MPHIELNLEDLPLDLPVRVEHEGMPIVVIHTETGVAAFEDRCPHAFWPLSEGEVFRGVLECAGHGWEFELPSGRCRTAPAYCLTPVSAVVDGAIVRLRWETGTDEEPAQEDVARVA